jgi:hypothetical protein
MARVLCRESERRSASVLARCGVPDRLRAQPQILSDLDDPCGPQPPGRVHDGGTRRIPLGQGNSPQSEASPFQKPKSTGPGERHGVRQCGATSGWRRRHRCVDARHQPRLRQGAGQDHACRGATPSWPASAKLRLGARSSRPATTPRRRIGKGDLDPIDGVHQHSLSCGRLCCRTSQASPMNSGHPAGLPYMPQERLRPTPSPTDPRSE